MKGEEIDDSLIGGNASAEAPDEAATGDTEVRTEVDIVVRGRLVETGFGKKKDYQGHIKV